MIVRILLVIALIALSSDSIFCSNEVKQNFIAKKLKTLSYNDKGTAGILVGGLLAAAILFSQRPLPSPDETYVMTSSFVSLGLIAAWLVDIYFPESSHDEKQMLNHYDEQKSDAESQSF